MPAVTSFIQRHPVPTYFALTFTLSWAGVLLVVGGPAGIPGTADALSRLFPLALLAMLVGPTVSGLLLTRLVHGPRGLADLRSRLLRWRIGLYWYAIAMLTAPVLMMTTLFALSLASPAFLPGIVVADDKAARLAVGLAVGLAAGFFEELGWTGFAIPALRARRGLFATGAIVGMCWGAWHLLVNLWALETTAGALPRSLHLAALAVGLVAGSLPAFRVLMVWVYERTGSLLVAMLMHLSLTASVLVINPLAIAGAAMVAYDLTIAAVFWAAVAVVVRLERRTVAPLPFARTV